MEGHGEEVGQGPHTPLLQGLREQVHKQKQEQEQEEEQEGEQAGGAGGAGAGGGGAGHLHELRVPLQEVSPGQEAAGPVHQAVAQRLGGGSHEF